MSSAPGIAIVGIGCRFPGGVVDVSSFWRLLEQGGDAITEVPASRYDLARFYDERPATPGRTMSRYGGFVEPIESFDAAFFDISPREAQTLDPHQRLLLEVAWEALEDAGADTTRLRGSRTGVYVGQWVSDFESRLFADPDRIDFLMTTGSGRYAASGRLSYALGLRGPSVSIDTACSSSLVSVHLATRALRSGECALALAGGVNVILQPHITIAYSQSRMMAADGHCKFGDASGDGYVRSEGAGIVVLKRLPEALADGDRIYAVIRGSAVNNDGTSSGVLGRPSRIGHEEVLRAAYADAGIAPARVGYVEAHGTGTRAGDPVEIGALAAVLGEGRGAGLRCAMGSVKTNIGHTESAAGVAGLIKATLALHHAAIPPSLHFKEPNPRVPWSDLPLEIAQTLRAWPDGGHPRFAGVNSFGISGTNAHLVLEAAPAASPGPHAPGGRVRPQVLTLSARSPQALRVLAARFADRLGVLPEPQLADVLWSAATRRGALEHRAAFVAHGAAGFVEALRRHADGEAGTSADTFAGAAFAETPPRVVLVCPGQGGQWLGMARELLQREPAFRAAMQRCDAAARPHLGESLLELLAHAPEGTMQRIDHVQPLLVALAIAWGEALRAAGVEADAVVGHSMGEVAAAHLAGVIDLDQAMRIICRRSALMARESGRGAMALVDLPSARMDERLRAMPSMAGRVGVAVVNSPRSCVVSGETAAVHHLLQVLQGEQVFCRPVQVDVASHSPQMDGASAALAAELADLRPAAGRIPWYSSVHAAPLPGEQAVSDYWAANLRQPVRFGDTVARLAADGMTVFIELGPHPVLKPSIEQTLESAPQAGPAKVALCAGHREEGDDLAWHKLLAGLWTLGVQPDWRRMLAPGRYVPLPSYPWQRERHWGEAAQRQAGSVETATSAISAGGRRHPLLQRSFDAAPSAGTQTALWETTLSTLPAGAHRVYLDHRVRDAAVLPAAAMVEAVLAAARESRPDSAWILVDTQFVRALPLEAEGKTRMQVRIDWTGKAAGRFEVQTLAAGTPEGNTEGVVHCRGVVRAVVGEASRPTPLAALASPAEGAVGEALEAAAVYDLLADSGLPYGPAFRCIESLRLMDRDGSPGAAEALFLADAAKADPHATDHLAYPPLLDAALQALLTMELRGADEPTMLRVPVAIGRIALLRPLRPAQRIHARVARDGSRLQLFDDEDHLLAWAEGVRFAPAGALQPSLGSLLHRLTWSPSEPTAATAKEASVPGPLLVLGAGAGLAEALVQRFAAAGTCTRVLAEPVLDDATVGDAWRALQATAPAARVQLLDLRALDLSSAEPPDLGSIEAAWSGAIEGVRSLARALAEASPAPGLWLATRGAVAAGEARRVAYAQGALWGIGRVLAHEHPQWDVRLLDLECAPSPVLAEAGALASLLAAPPADRQLAWREGRWQAPHLGPLPPAPAMAAPTTPAAATAVANWHAAIAEPGAPQSLHWLQAGRPAPAAGMVEIEVEAAGLNFLDLLSALAAFPGVAGGVRPLGIECAGRVARVGPGVKGLAVGDAVLAICPRSLGRYTTAHEALVHLSPAGLSALHAAGVPIAFATVWHSLADLARLEPGETVLVHSAAGGVGLAALQVVHHLGGHVIATAGTPDKRAWLRKQGIAHVFDSRSTAFADEVLAATGGRGVDVVLNALAGEAIEAGLRCLATGGRFIEMGKRDIYGGTAMSLESFRKSLGYFAVDLDSMMRDRPQRLGRILREVVQRFESGHFAPLPVHRYESARLADAFRDLMPGTHTGKHVVDLTTPPPAVTLAEGGHALVRGDGCYLVTGGLGALGLRLAHWLAERGAGRVVLTGRRGPDAAALERIAAMQALGTVVQVEHCDVADGADFAALLERVRQGAGPGPAQLLRGVLHAAGVLDDALVTDIDPARARAVRDPKVLGAWHIDRLTAADPLDFVVLLSSVASLLGTPGQGAYAAANAFMDALAHDRNARGLRTLAVNLGPVRGEGLAARKRLRGDSLARLGLDGLDAAQVVAAIDLLLASGESQAACMRLDVARWHAATRREGALGLIAPVAADEAAARNGAAAEASLQEQLTAAPAGQPRRALMEAMLREEIGQVLRIAAVRVPADRPLRALGLDSLMALELRSRLERRTALTLSPTLAWNHPTVQLLGAHLAERLGLSLDAPAVTEAAPEAAASLGQDASTGDEVEALLAQLQSLDTDEAARLLDTTEGPAR